MLRFGHPSIFLSRADSTNNYIADHTSLPDLAEGTAILTYNQVNGRGQRGRSWVCVPDKDIAVSFIIRPVIEPMKMFLLNKVIALSVQHCVADFGISKVRIKWPNDIYIEDKKVAGLLIEPQWTGERCKHVVIGVGLNVNSDEALLPAGAQSLFSVLNNEIPLSDVFESLCRHLDFWYQKFNIGDEERIEQDYTSLLLGVSECLNILIGETEVKGVIQGVDSSGRLLVRSGEKLLRLSHGDAHVDYFMD